MPRTFLLMALLLAFTACSQPASPPKLVAATAPAYPTTPIVTLTRCRTFAADFPDFVKEHLHDSGSYDLTELQLHLLMPEPMTRFPENPLTVSSYSDDRGADLCPAISSTYWPTQDVYANSPPLSQDRHHVLILVNSKTALAAGATRLTLRGKLAVPVGRNPATRTFADVPLEIGATFSLGPRTFTLQRMYSEAAHKDSNSGKTIPALYTYQWRADGELEMIDKLELLDAAGKPLPTEVTLRSDWSEKSLLFALPASLDSVTVRGTFFGSIESVLIPVDISTTLAGTATPEPTAAAPGAETAQAASRPAASVRILALKTGTPIDESLWTPASGLGDRPAAPEWSASEQAGILLSCVVTPPEGFVAAFDPAKVVITSARDDRATDVLPALEVLPGLNIDRYRSPYPMLLAGDRRAALFAVRVLTPTNPAARSIILRGHLTVNLDSASRDVMFSAANLHAGQRLQVGPHTVTLIRLETDTPNLRYDFDCGGNPLIRSLTFLGPDGEVLPDQHYTKYKDPNTLEYTLLTPKRPASLRITYFPDPRPREIPFTLTATLGL